MSDYWIRDARLRAVFLLAVAGLVVALVQTAFYGGWETGYREGYRDAGIDEETIRAFYRGGTWTIYACTNATGATMWTLWNSKVVDAPRAVDRQSPGAPWECIRMGYSRLNP